MSKIFVIPFFLIAFIQIGFGQQPSVREWRKRADEAYAQGNFPAAYQFYKAALQYPLSMQDSMAVLFPYAESARQFNAFEPAEAAYEILLNNQQTQEYPLIAYWLAVMEQQQGKYEEAQTHFQTFLNQMPTPDAKYRQLAQQGLENVAYAIAAEKRPSPGAPRRLGREINGSNAEYLADFLGDTMIIYSSLDGIYRKDTNKPPRKYTQLYTSVKGQAGKPLEELNEPGKHVANLVFNRDQSRIYYTICEYKETSIIEVRCDVYTRERKSDGSFGEKQKLSINAENAQFTTTQPAIAYDAQNNRELLFFVSDRPVNAGDTPNNLNIWMGTINAAGEVTNATALPASVNTAGNEAAPFFYPPTQTLYFSSDGHSPNYGGYDIYEADLNNNTWTNAKVLDRPINTGYDELHFVLRDTKTGTAAYFSTNMPVDTVERTYVDPAMKACCWDILEVDYEIKLLVRTLLASNGSNIPLKGATLLLYEDGQLRDSIYNRDADRFLFKILPNKKYDLVGRHADFNYEQTATIDPLPTEYIGRDTVKREFIFAPIRLIVNTFKQSTGEDLDQPQLTVSGSDGKNVPSSMVDANTFAFEVQRGKQYQINGQRFGFMDETASANLTAATYRDSIQVERNLYFRQELEVLICDAASNLPLGGATVDRKRLESGRITNLEVVNLATDSTIAFYGYNKFDMQNRYQFIVTRGGYEAKTVEVAFTEQQMRGSKGKFEFRICLDKKEFQPITLYYDNDVPGPQDRRIVTTNIPYDKTYEAYYKKKDEFIDFIDKARGYSDNERFIARNQYESIFDQELQQNFRELQSLAGDILKMLQQGNSIKLAIEATASPLGSGPYNLSLSKRRIDSVRKYLLNYGDGKDKIANYHPRRFEIIGMPYGEGRASAEARKALGSGRSGVFDIFATLERRVTITELIINGQSISLNKL